MTDILTPTYCVFDDLRSFKSSPGNVTYCRRPNEFIEHAITDQNVIDVLVLDHDLGMDAKGNYLDVRDALRLYTSHIEMGSIECPGSVYVVTSNPAGARWIISEMERYTDNIVRDINGFYLGLESRWG